MYTTISPETHSRITLVSSSAYPKRTINKCADILSSHGQLIDYEKQSSSRFQFCIDIKRDRIRNMITALQDVNLVDKNIQTPDMESENIPFSKHTRVNIYLTFLPA